MKKFTKKLTGKASTVIWIIAAVCGILSFIYYLSTGEEIIVSLISAILVSLLSMLAISVIAGAVFGAVEAIFFPKKSNAPEKSSAKSSEYSVQEETFEAVGVHYYLENVGKLATRNPDWRKNGKALVAAGFAGRRVYRYTYVNKPVKLIQENDNPHDRNAVMVQIAGEKVGYIDADEALHVRDILNHHIVYFISGFVGGGDYKEVREDGTFERYEAAPFVRVKIRYK